MGGKLVFGNVEVFEGSPKAFGFWPYNPRKRTEEADPKLVESLREEGQLAPVHVGRDGFVGDGHRRLVAARALGWTSIRYEQHANKTSDELFCEMNRTQVRIAEKHLLEVLIQRPDLMDRMPEDFIGRVERAERHVGWSGLRKLVKHRRGPSYVTGSVLPLYEKLGRVRTAGAIMKWMLDTQSKTAVDQRLNYGPLRPEIVIGHLDEFRTLPRP